MPSSLSHLKSRANATCSTRATDEPAARRSASPARSASPLRSPSPAGPSDDDGDEYRTEAVRKMPKIGKKKRVTEDGDDAEPQP